MDFMIEASGKSQNSILLALPVVPRGSVYACKYLNIIRENNDGSVKGFRSKLPEDLLICADFQRYWSPDDARVASNEYWTMDTRLEQVTSSVLIAACPGIHSPHFRPR